MEKRWDWSEEALVMTIANKDDDPWFRHYMIEAIAKATGRSKDAVRKKAWRMKDRAPWSVLTNGDVDRVRPRKSRKNEWQAMSKGETEFLGGFNKAFRHGQPWLEYEDQLIKRWDGEESLFQVAYVLGRTYRAIESRRQALRKRGEL